MPFCSQFGSANPDSAIFCSCCGEKLITRTVTGEFIPARTAPAQRNTDRPEYFVDESPFDPETFFSQQPDFIRQSAKLDERTLGVIVRDALCALDLALAVVGAITTFLLIRADARLMSFIVGGYFAVLVLGIGALISKIDIVSTFNGLGWSAVFTNDTKLGTSPAGMCAGFLLGSSNSSVQTDAASRLRGFFSITVIVAAAMALLATAVCSTIVFAFAKEWLAAGASLVLPVAAYIGVFKSRLIFGATLVAGIAAAYMTSQIVGYVIVGLCAAAWLCALPMLKRAQLVKDHINTV